MAKILVVDDEMGIRELLSEILDDEGHEILLAENATAARPLYAAHDIDLVLLDIWMPDTDGMSLLREWLSTAPLRCPVIMMSGHASIETAVEAQGLGAVGFLEKPITLHKLLAAVHKALYRTAALVAAPVVPDLPIASASPLEPHVSNVLTAPAATVATVALESAALAVGVETHTSEPVAQNDTANVQTPIAVLPTLSMWHQALSRTTLDTGLREFREEVERIYFTYILEREQWAMTRVAEQAGLERTHLYRKLKQLSIEINRKAKT